MDLTPQLINVGTNPDDHTGDSPRDAGNKINTALVAIQAAITALIAGGGGGSDGSTLSLTGTTTGQLLVNAAGALGGLTLGTSFKRTANTIDVDGVDPGTLPVVTASPAGATVILLTTAGPKQILVTDFLAGLSSGGSPGDGSSGGGSTTALTMSNAVYTDRGDGTNKKMLSSGSATGIVPIAAGNFVLRVRQRSGTSSLYNDSPFVSLTNSAGDIVGISSANKILVPYTKAGGYDGHTGDNGGNYQDGAIHEYLLAVGSDAVLSTGGVTQGDRYLNGGFTARGNMTLSVSTGGFPGIMDVSVYSGTASALGALQFTYPFDGSGASA